MARVDVKVIIDAIDNASKTFKNVGEGATKMGQSLATLGAGPALALAGATKTAIDFESAFAGVRKTVDASEAEFAQLSQNIRDIAKEAPVSTTELSQIGEMAGQLGVSGVDNLTKFTETVSKISVTTNLTSEAAATSFARISNVMQEPIETVDQMASVVVDLGNNFATTESEIVEFSSRIAGAGKIAGLTSSDIFGIGAAMSSVGVQAEAGGTAVQKALISMNTAVAQGNEDLAVFADTAGMSAEEFKSSWEEDASGAFTRFVEGLGAQGDDAINTLSALGLEDQRLIRSFLSLANAGDLLGESLETSGKAFEENTALTEEAEKRYATTESQMLIMKNQVADLGITIGNAVLPALNGMLKAIKPVVEGVADFASRNPKLVTTVLALGAGIGVLGAVLIPLGAIITSVSTIMAGFGAVMTFIGTVTIPTMLVAMAPIILTVGLIAGAIALLVVAWRNNWGDIQGKTESAVEFIKNGINGLKERFMEFVNFVTTIPERWDAFIERLKQRAVIFFVEELPLALGMAVGRLIRFATEDVPNFVQRTIDWFEVLPGRILSALQLALGHTAQAFQNMVTVAGEKASNLVERVGNWLSELPGRIGTAVSSIPEIMGNAFKQAGENAKQAVKDMVESITGWIGDLGEKISGMIEKAKSLGSQAKTSFETGVAVGGERAMGGEVSSATPYLVGEKGPEIFQPHTAGRIIPTKDIMNAGGPSGGNTINISVNANLSGDMDIDRLVERLQWTISKQGLL